MQVNSVSSSSFGQKNVAPREALEILANADDKELKYWARQQASIAVNDKKHNRIHNMLYWSLPVAAGLAAVVNNPAKAISTVGNAAKNVRIFSPVMRNLGNFAKTAASWAGTFMFIDVLFAGRNKLTKENGAVRKFDKEHPVLSFIATAGAAIGAVILGGKAISKLSPYVSKMIKPQVEVKVLEKMIKVDNKLANSKVLDKAAKGLKAIPSAIKSVLKGTVTFSPLLLLFANVAHSTNHYNAKREETLNQYMQIKQSQAVAQTVIGALDKIQKEAAEA